jgi:hypothetical protein
MRGMFAGRLERKIAKVCRDTSGNLVEENRIIEGIVNVSLHQRREKQ